MTSGLGSEVGIIYFAYPRAFVQTSATVSKGQEDLIHELATMARGRKEPPAEGPIRLGPSASIAEVAGIEGLAAHYWYSFQTSRRAFPYFDDGEGGA